MAVQVTGRGSVLAGLRARHDRLERMVGKLVAPGEVPPADAENGGDGRDDLPLIPGDPRLHGDGLKRAGVEASADSRP